MSDLQCAATLLLVAGSADPTPLPDQLRDLRVAAVYAAPAQRFASPLAAALGLPLREDAELAEASYRAALGTIADLHRGETVLVALADEPLLDLLGALGHPMASAPSGPVPLAIDADGWVLRDLDQ